MVPIIFILMLLPVKQDTLQIENAWIRPAAKGMNSALYFDIKNNSNAPQTLYKVECGIGRLVEIHETYKSDDKMRMRKVENVVVKGRSSFRFKPGRHHVMLIRVKEDLKEGNEYDVTFLFKNGTSYKMKVPVKRAD